MSAHDFSRRADRGGASAIFARVSSTAVAPSERGGLIRQQADSDRGGGRRPRARVYRAAVKEKLDDFSVVREGAGSVFTCCETRKFRRRRA